MRKFWPILLLLVPVLEIWSIAQMSNWIGGWMTLWLLIAFAVLGIYLIKTNGTRAWKRMQEQVSVGRPPGHTLLNGIFIVIGGVLLIIPGFFSDIIALLFLLPFTRVIFKGVMLLWIERWMRSGKFVMMRRR